jgi:hypothetical protein
VSWRRSADEGAAAAVDDFCPSARAETAAAPQLLQKRLSAGFSLPQALQLHGRGEPQSPQNFEPVPTLAPHRGQFIRFPFAEALSPSWTPGERCTETQEGMVEQWASSERIAATNPRRVMD